VNLNNITRKAQEFLKTEKGEEVSDKLLDGGAAVANKVTGNKHADKIQNARDSADKHVGRDEDSDERPASPKSR
jgi:basic membrane lipoprotein Med (substrate-binding protein (PBP1-ABC) superfamily)